MNYPDYPNYLSGTFKLLCSSGGIIILTRICNTDLIPGYAIVNFIITTSCDEARTCLAENCTALYKEAFPDLSEFTVQKELPKFHDLAREHIFGLPKAEKVRVKTKRGWKYISYPELECKHYRRNRRKYPKSPKS